MGYPGYSGHKVEGCVGGHPRAVHSVLVHRAPTARYLPASPSRPDRLARSIEHSRPRRKQNDVEPSRQRLTRTRARWPSRSRDALPSGQQGRPRGASRWPRAEANADASRCCRPRPRNTHKRNHRSVFGPDAAAAAAETAASPVMRPAALASTAPDRGPRGQFGRCPGRDRV